MHANANDIRKALRREREARLMRQVEQGLLSVVEASMMLDSDTRAELLTLRAGFEQPTISY